MQVLILKRNDVVLSYHVDTEKLKNWTLFQGNNYKTRNYTFFNGVTEIERWGGNLKEIQKFKGDTQIEKKDGN